MLKKKNNSIYLDIRKNARLVPNSLAVEYKKKKVTYKNFNRSILRLSKFLKKIKIENFFVKMENSLALINSMYAISNLKKNLILSNLENNFEDDYIFIKQKKINCILLEKNFFFKIKKVIDQKKKIIFYKDKNFEIAIILLNQIDGFINFKNKIIIFSSGTTKTKKSIILNHSNLMHVTKKMKTIMKIKEKLFEIIFLPITQSFAFARMRYVFSLGGCILLETNQVRFDQIIRKIIKKKINSIGFTSGAAIILHKFYKKIFLSTKNYLKIIEIGSDHLDIRNKKFLIKNFPKTNKFYHYGLTEASRSSLQKLNKLNDLKNCGKKFCCSDILIKKRKNEKIGEIQIRGNNVFEGYLENKRIKSHNEKYFSTGDFGYMKNEKLYFVGRKDDIINLGGKKISCDEIRDILDKFNEVLESCVISIFSKSNIFNKKIVCFVVLKKKNYKDTVLKKIHKIRPKMLVPNSIYFINNLPKTNTGKIKRIGLMKMLKSYETE